MLTGPVTTRFGGGVKSWAWSYSKLRNYEICPKRHYEIDILKKVQDVDESDPNSALVWGKRVHDSMKDRLKSSRPLPVEMVDYEQFAKRIDDKVALTKGELLVEQKYAITRSFTPTGYFAPDVWYRGIADVLVVAPPVALVVDWKTGRIQEDSVQLALMAQCIFSFYPAVERVAARFAWLKEHAETDEIFSRQDLVKLWPSLLERIGFMERSSQTMDYPPKPNAFCKKYCPVTACPYHGKGGH